MRLPVKFICFCIPLYLVNASAETAESGSSRGDEEVVKSTQQTGIDSNQQRDFETRSQNIEALLLAYRRIASETGNTDEFNVIESQVGLDIQQAKKNYQSKNYSTGRNILERVYAVLKTAIIQLRGGSTLINSRSADEQYDIKTTRPKYLREYERLNNSIDTLIVAYKRVSVEKGQQEQASILDGNITIIKARADKHFESGDYSTGNDLLNGAYTLIKEALISLRDGDTLVQSLNFANKQEEYQYYVRKTHSQKTAIQILLKISNDASKNALLNSILGSTQNMLDEASSLAAENKYDAAIPIMDQVFTRLQSGLMMSLSSR